MRRGKYSGHEEAQRCGSDAEASESSDGDGKIMEVDPNNQQSAEEDETALTYEEDVDDDYDEN